MTQSNGSPVTRRGVIASATVGAGVAAAGGMRAMAPTSARKTFVLVHGAWHGGWCWRRVSDLLEARGHKVFAPTMTGLGERSHLMSKDVVLDTHIADIVNVIEWEDLTGICLVAHSYGGWPVSGAVEKVLDRVTSVVFLDAFVPEDGQRSLDVASDFSRKGTLEAIAKGEISRPAPASRNIPRQREGPRLGRFEAYRAAGRRGAPAHQARGCAREGGEEDLHPRPNLSATGFRQILRGQEGGRVMAHL
jgi:pimeloyl-ACP methyl ester carboxylesterase